MTAPSSRRRISPERELRYALLAAMETCWVYVVLSFLAALGGLSRSISPLSIFVAYWLALLVGRALPLSRVRWLWLQAAAIGVALVTLLVIVRVEIYPYVGLLDFSWLGRYFSALTGFAQGASADVLATLAVAYVFIRGLGFGQRPLTLWFIGFQFRLGIVVFFFILLASALMKRVDVNLGIFAYFFISLLAIALARMEEMGTQVPLGPRWGVTLVAAVTLVLFLGLGILQFFTLDVADAIVRVLAVPAGIIAGLVILLIVIPASFIAGWLIDLLRPLFDNLKPLNDMLSRLVPPLPPEQTQKLQEQASWLDALGPILKILFIAAVVIGIGILLARSLNRRMRAIEEETYIREAIGDEEDARIRDARRKKTAPRRRGGSLTAESIRRIYAALVARASDAGVPRRAAETPYEFLPRLRQAWPEEAEQIDVITEAYIAVHYGELEADKEQVSRVRRAWEEAQRMIRRRMGGRA